MPTVTQMVSNLRGIQTAIKDVARVRQILSVLAKHGFGALVTRLNLTETVGLRGLMDYKDEREELYSIPQRLRMAIEELGPTTIKLAQILSTRSDLLPPEVLAEFQSLQDKVPPMPWADVRAQVENELEQPIGALFALFEDDALASASIAQVHHAVTKAGDAVVVKVQRPGIEPLIDSDLSIMDFLARRAERAVPELRLMDPVGMVAEFDKAVRKELDFTNERAHILQFRKNFASTDGVRIPRVHDALCTRRILTLDFVEGVKVTRAPEELGIDPGELAPRMLNVLLKMLFQDGFFHGDLHPGNILIDEEGSIGLIDFGLAGKVSPRQRDTLLDILIGVSREDYALVARTFFEIGMKVPGVSYDFVAFEDDTVRIMETHFQGKTLSDVDIGAFFAELVGGAIKHRIKMPPVYTMVFKAMITVEGIGKTLTPDLNLVEEAQPFVRQMLLQRYSPRRLLWEGVEIVTGLTRFARNFPTAANQLLREIEQGSLKIRADVEDVRRLVAEQRYGGEQLVRAVLAAACLVAGTVALGAPAPHLLGVSVISEVFWGLAAALGWRLFRAAPPEDG